MTTAAAWRPCVHRAVQGHGQRHARGQRGRGDPASTPTGRATGAKAFSGAHEEALEQAMDLLEGEARRRATGIKRDVWYAGEVVGEESVRRRLPAVPVCFGWIAGWSRPSAGPPPLKLRLS